MQLDTHEIHIWSTHLKLTEDEANEQLKCLSKEEQMRAKRLRLPLHQQRFIANYYFLRTLLAQYLSVTPKDIMLAHTSYGKPYLAYPKTHLQFNLSHSQERGLYAFTLNHAIGVDIEKIQTSYRPAVANRYFSPAENKALAMLTGEAKIAGFLSSLVA